MPTCGACSRPTAEAFPRYRMFPIDICNEKAMSDHRALHRSLEPVRPARVFIVSGRFIRFIVEDVHETNQRCHRL